MLLTPKEFHVSSTGGGRYGYNNVRWFHCHDKQHFGNRFTARLPNTGPLIIISLSKSICWHLKRSWKPLNKADLSSPGPSRSKARFESLKWISFLILFVYKLMIKTAKNNRKNYPKKFFWTQKNETPVKFNPGLSANTGPCILLSYQWIPRPQSNGSNTPSARALFIIRLQATSVSKVT